LVRAIPLTEVPFELLSVIVIRWSAPPVCAMEQRSGVAGWEGSGGKEKDARRIIDED
jgi:hypothetical protein